MHPRKRIRAAVVELLKAHAGLSALVVDRVFPTRVDPLGAGRLPCVLVYTDEEDAEHGDTAPRRYKRPLTLRVECVDRSGEALDDRLDDLAEQVEDCLLREGLLDDPVVGDLMHDIEYAGMSMGIRGEAERHVGALSMRWTVTYETELPEPVLDAFETINSKFDLPAPDGAAEAEDHITLPQE